jgi:hypothetical protein
MASPGPSHSEVHYLTRRIQGPMVKSSLQNICTINGLSKGGNKSDLQRRIISCKSLPCFHRTSYGCFSTFKPQSLTSVRPAVINDCAARNDVQAFQEIRKSILDCSNPVPQTSSSFLPPPPAYNPTTTPSHTAQPSYTMSPFNYTGNYTGANGHLAPNPLPQQSTSKIEDAVQGSDPTYLTPR